jgi:hypothetical protein
MVIWDERDIIQTLRRVGFTIKESIRLIKWRKHYVRGELDLGPLEYRRLMFARWLIEHGKLTDQ